MANEVRLIDASRWDELYKEQTQNLIPYDHYCDGYLDAMDRVDDWIDNQPTIDPESLRPKGRWEIHCRTTYDSWTRETDEEFYLECSECKRQVWDVDYMAVQNDDIQKLIEKYPYCHCGCKMEG